MSAPRPSTRRSLPWALALFLLTGLPARADTLALPTAETAVEVTAPYTRVTITADGRVEHAGIVATPGAELRLPTLLPSLKAYVAGATGASVLLAGDGRADFRATRMLLVTMAEAGFEHVGFLVAPDAAPPRAIGVSHTVAGTGAARELTLAPLTVHVTATYFCLLRTADDFVAIPRIDGALDLPRLAALFDEDRRLHPSARFFILNTDDGVAYADMIAALDLSRAKGYARTLLAGGPPLPPTPPITPPVLAGPVETFVSVRLLPNGDTDLRAADGTVDLVRHAAVTAYEAHCDPTACDIVLRTESRRASLGMRPRDARFPDMLFGQVLHEYAGRLGLPEPAREGVYSPLVQSPGVEAP